jgi:hypothetical protein
MEGEYGTDLDTTRAGIGGDETCRHKHRRQTGAVPEHPSDAGRSTISIAGIEYLLVDAGATAVHLALRDDHRTDAGHPAVPAPPPRAHRFNATELAEGWLPTTLCGREWLRAATEADDVWAPDCRTCLRLVDRRLGAQPPDERMPMLVHLVTAAVAEHGSAEVTGVPGEQLTALRAAVRAQLRAHGFRSQTFVEGDLLLVTSDDAREAMSDEARRQHQLLLAEAMQRISLGSEATPPGTGDWRFRWSDWHSS